EAVHSMPPWIARRLVAAYGEAEAEPAAAAMNEAAPLSLRVALWRTARDEAAAAIGGEVRPAPYLPEGLLVRGAGALEELAPFQRGLVTAQDVAAQLVGPRLGPRPGEPLPHAGP